MYFKTLGGGGFSEDTRKKGKRTKTGTSDDWRSFYLSRYDWLKGSHMAKVVWLPNEADYSCCELYSCRNECSISGINLNLEYLYFE